MNIQDFLQQSVGKWFHHRTSLELMPQASEVAKANLWIDLLPMNDPSIVAICTQANLDPVGAVGALKISWDGRLERQDNSHVGATHLLFVAKGEDQGYFLQTQMGQDTLLHQGHYYWGSDESLTLTLEHQGGMTEERLWYASENLRLRTSLRHQGQTVQVVAFCSEIRMGLAAANPSN
ncbi:phycobiliprotein lyase [Synechococcales cyanobacterium C]|uniref:Chromophore lyase CpcS/CpeS n=1 Tax=Petrachloros mirabilis ULC683 TaxID=2781853 RepID=A0A8K2A0H0_9CYAN|nr:phycobiliprotein lyase [Petrachloros mirabilis]NCJ07316.1 phycobiliprotein lyase [Petrachloros mirabilis ULC683]